MIETLKDGEKGYTTAADDATRPDLKDLFREYAIQRQTFARNLQQYVKDLGDEPEDSGSVAGDLHRGWINLKATVAAREDLAILEECVRGDESAVKTYTAALSVEDLGPAHTMVEMQLAEIRAACERVRLEKDSLEPPSDTPDDRPVVLV